MTCFGTNVSHVFTDLYLTRRVRGERLEDIGRGFNISKYSSLSSSIEKIRKEILTNGMLKRRISKVEALLTNSQRQTTLFM